MRTKPAPKKPSGWHPEDIKAAVRKTGVSLSELARMTGLPDQACRQALITPNQRGEDAIAERINVPARTLWPHRFSPDGYRLHQARALRSGPKSTDLRHVRHRQKGAAE